MNPRSILAAPLAALLFAGTPAAAQYDPPADYYAGLDGLSGAALDAALNAKIRVRADGSALGFRSYDSLRQDLAITDRDWDGFPPEDGSILNTTRSNILLVYSFGWSGYSRSGLWDSGATWNREHCWPDSRGVGQPDGGSGTTGGKDFSDLHQLRAANSNVNSARGNLAFDDVGGTAAAHQNAPEARKNGSAWEPPAVDKGWIARSMAYMATRYDGTEPDTTDLVLVEFPPTSPSASANIPQMGKLSTLLRWNRLYPPSVWERRRNEIIFQLYQFNRNPFIDVPEFADLIYGAPAGQEGVLLWRTNHFSIPELADSAVSGELMDPDQDGLPNLVERAFDESPRQALRRRDGLGRVLPLAEPASTTGRLRVVYRRLKDRALINLAYAVELRDPATGVWTTAANPAEVSVQDEGGLTELVTVEVDAASLAGPNLVRVRVTRG